MSAPPPREEPLFGFGVHPAAALFPVLSDVELAELAADIAKNGLRHPVVIFEGRVLDGRNRLRACRLANLIPSFETLEKCDDVVSYVVSANLRRRHMDESQRALVAARLAILKDGQRADRQGAQISAPTQERAAEMLSVSRGSVQNARTVLDKGAPELVAAVERGEAKVSAAATVARLPHADQARVVAAGQIKQTAAAIRHTKPEPVEEWDTSDPSDAELEDSEPEDEEPIIRSEDRAPAWGDREVTAKAAEVSILVRDFRERVERAFREVDPRFASAVREKSQDIVLSALLALKDLLPPKGGQPKLSVITGGK